MDESKNTRVAMFPVAHIKPFHDSWVNYMEEDFLFGSKPNMKVMEDIIMFKRLIAQYIEWGVQAQREIDKPVEDPVVEEIPEK